MIITAVSCTIFDSKISFASTAEDNVEFRQSSRSAPVIRPLDIVFEGGGLANGKNARELVEYYNEAQRQTCCYCTWKNASRSIAGLIGIIVGSVGGWFLGNKC